LFASRYQQWKRQKSIISSAFYSRKLKLLKPIMDKSVDQLIQSLNSVCDSGIPLDVSEYFTCFSLYFMLTVVFDIEVGELSKFKHPIITSYKKFITKKINLAQSICFVHPFLAKIINLYFLSYKSISKLRNILNDAIKQREVTKNAEISPEINFIDILLSFESEFGNENTSESFVLYK
jgi:cytochrome P450